jgi:hypothetical protein
MLQTFKTGIIMNTLKTINFDKLAGLKASLYYNNHQNQFQLGDVLFEVKEDESDGYRSMLGSISILSTKEERKPGEYLAGVTITKLENSDFDGYELIDDVDNHIWLRFGTDCQDQWYPCFVFIFYPKGSDSYIENLKKAIK